MGEDLIIRAAAFAKNAHHRINQRRKYSLDPYDVHLKDVAEMVSTAGGDAEMIAAAWLHDIIEDTAVTYEELEREFGPGVADMVSELTDVSRPSDGNRKLRKAIDLAHTATVSPRAKTIKLADLIDNSLDITRHDPRFARVFLAEMRALLNVLEDGNPALYDRARVTLDRCTQKVPSNSPPEPNVADDVPLDVATLLARQTGMRSFTSAFAARDIVEPLVSFDSETLSGSAPLKEAGSRESILGVRERGRITGYLIPPDAAGELAGPARTIAALQVLEIDAPLVDVIHVLTHFSFCFVALHGSVFGVIRRADIEKPVARMWLFGMVMLIEMVVVELIRKKWPGESWADRVSAGRLLKAREMFQERQRRNVRCDLLDCLQFSDKIQIVTQVPGFAESSGFSSAAAVKRTFQELELLRNNLAHGQEISVRDWPSIVRLTARIHDILQHNDKVKEKI